MVTRYGKVKEPLEHVVEATKHLKEPQEINGTITGAYSAIEIAEVGFLFAGCDTDFDPDKRELIYVAGLSDGKLFFSNTKQIDRKYGDHIHSEGTPLQNLCFYRRVYGFKD